MDETIRALKTARGRAKGKVTGKINRVRDLLSSPDQFDSVRSELQSLEAAWKEFLLVHEKFHSLLSSEEEIETSNDYFSSIELTVQSSFQAAELYFHSSTATAQDGSVKGSRSGSSRVSSAESARHKASARRATLLKSAEFAEGNSKLEFEELEVQHKRDLEDLKLKQRHQGVRLQA